MKGLHGELFGVLGAPSPRADPALLAGLGAGWCTLYKERGTTTYSAALARTPVHHPQASTLQQGRVATLVLVVHLFRCIALQNQKCSWTRFALAVPAPTTLTCSLHHIAVTFEPSTTRLVLFSNDNAISDGGVALPEAIFGDHSTISQTAATHPRAVLTKSAFQ